MTAKFELDPDFAREFTSSAEILEMLVPLAEAVKQRASDLYPDDPRTVDRDLHTDLSVDIGLGVTGYVARVNANNWKAHWYEFGSARTRPVHALARALEENVGPLQPGSDDAD